mgnify:CR=1 FL=1
MLFDDFVTCSLVSNKEDISRFAGRTVTAGCWMKSSSATTLKVADSAGNVIKAHGGGGGWEWLELSRTFADDITAVNPFVVRAVATETIYLSQPMLVFGSSIGEGNYTRPQGESIWFQQVEYSNTYDKTVSISSSTNHGVEGDSNGVVPKGVKAIYVSLEGECATVEKYLKLRSQTPSVDINIQLHSQVSNISNITQGFIPVGPNGLIRMSRNDTFNNVELIYLGVELR